MNFRVTSVNESTNDRVMVVLVEEGSTPGVPVPYGLPSAGSTVNLNLPTKEAEKYFPGKLFTLTIKAV